MAGSVDSVQQSELPAARTQVAQGAPGPGGFVTSFASANSAAKPAIPEQVQPKAPARIANDARSNARNVSRGSGPYIVQLGAFEDRGNAEAAMHGMALKAPTVIGQNPLMVEANETRSMGLMYRIRTTQTSDRRSADTLCAQMKVHRLPCFVTVVR